MDIKAENGVSAHQRHRRANPKRRREEIYCYDVEDDRHKSEIEESNSEDQNQKSEED